MLELKDISRITPDGKKILKNINLKFDDERLIAITGPNGGGKTSLAKVMMGIDMPTSGKIILDGEDITNLDITERAKRGISFAFQQPVRFKGITVKKLMEISTGEKLNKESLCEILQKVGLCANNYLHRDIDSTLSGGEMKRIEIASVLARHSRFSIFDEPEAGIDLWSFQNLIKVFEEMRNDLRGTTVIISHQERILETADEIVMIADGSVTDRGPGPEMIAKMLAAEKVQSACCSRRELFGEKLI